MTRRRIGIVSKFSRLVVVLIAAASFGTALPISRQVTKRDSQARLHRTVTSATTVAENSEYAIYTQHRPRLGTRLRSLLRMEDTVYAAILEREKHVLLEKRREAAFDLPPLPERRDTLRPWPRMICSIHRSWRRSVQARSSMSIGSRPT